MSKSSKKPIPFDLWNFLSSSQLLFEWGNTGENEFFRFFLSSKSFIIDCAEWKPNLKWHATWVVAWSTLYFTNCFSFKSSSQIIITKSSNAYSYYETYKKKSEFMRLHVLLFKFTWTHHECFWREYAISHHRISHFSIVSLLMSRIICWCLCYQ